MAGTHTNLLKTAKGLLESGNFTDLTLKAGSRTWAVHKAFVCPRSDFFMRACTGHFREAADGVIDLSSDNPDAVDAMVQYFYKQDYACVSFTDEDSYTGGTYHVRVHNIADKYDLACLKELATEKFREIAQLSWDTDVFPQYLAEIYNHGPETSELKSAAVEIASGHADELYKSPEKYKRYHEIASAIPEFANEVYKAVIMRAGGQNDRLAVCSDQKRSSVPGLFDD